MTLSPRDPVLTLYRTLLVYAAIGLVILTAGVVEFVHFEPFGEASGLHAHIVGVYRYDPATDKTIGSDQGTFKRAQLFAAVVDWSGLPENITVQALWYDSFGNVVGGVGPASPAALRNHTTIPAAIPSGLTYHLPGRYVFAVERLVNGVPVEVLARRLVLVER